MGKVAAKHGSVEDPSFTAENLHESWPKHAFEEKSHSFNSIVEPETATGNSDWMKLKVYWLVVESLTNQARLIETSLPFSLKQPHRAG